MCFPANPQRAVIESVWTKAGSYRIHTRETGPSGDPPLVLLHGLVVSSRYMMPLARKLAPRFAVYAPDLPGFGRSAASAAVVLDVPELADALAEWIDARGIAPVPVLAHSFGCQVLAAFICRHPGQVKKAVLVGPTVDPAGRTALQQAWRLTCDATEMLQLAPIVLRDLYDAGLRRFLLTFRHMLRDRIEERLPRVEVPTLVVRGGRDPVASQRWAEEVASLLPAGRLGVVPGGWHAPNFSAPRALARLVRSFLSPA